MIIQILFNLTPVVDSFNAKSMNAGAGVTHWRDCERGGRGDGGVETWTEVNPDVPGLIAKQWRIHNKHMWHQSNQESYRYNFALLRMVQQY